MNVRSLFFCVLCLLAATGAGCVQPIPPLPYNLAKYDELQKTHPRAYTSQTILLNNLSRALDVDLTGEERTASLELVGYVGGADPETLKEVSGILSEEGAPQSLRRKALEMLLKADAPDVASHVAEVLPFLQGDKELRTAALTWLARHPQSSGLAKVVKLWAKQPAITEAEHKRFEELVGGMAGKPWPQALLNGINAPSFLARGSALEILNRRVRNTQLREMILRMRPGTDAMAALRVFLERLGYLPKDGQEFLSTVLVYKTRQEMIVDAGRLSDQWADRYGYKFNIRDFHVLSRLARDPLRKKLRRGELILNIGRALALRPRVPAPGPTAPQRPEDRFSRQIDKLKMSDLWNLYLLNAMLSNERMQMALSVMADKDRQDRSRAWGGLVAYTTGQAEAKLYEASLAAGANDLIYVPTSQLVRDGRDSLCRFWGHFDNVKNARRVGPSPEELRMAKEDNHYALILTSLSKDEFCAHYYNSNGVVVSLGKFPFRK